MQMKLVLAIVVALLPCHAKAQQQQTEQAGFCESRTPQALHSPKCELAFVVQDLHRTDNVKIPHEPVYHTYSRWELDGRAYIFAYRDIDQRPDDMMADIYLAASGGYKRIGSIEITGMVTGVSTANLTGGNVPDILFQYEGGELHYLTIVRLSGGRVQQVFRYGASAIDVLSQPKPVIEATSKVANLVEQFAWDPHAAKFRKIEQHPFRTSQ